MSNDNTTKFRLCAKSLFLTYPQCYTEKGILFQNIKTKWGDNIDSLIVCKENHQDGHPHLHAAIRFLTEQDCKNAREYDSLVDPPKHGNYKACRKLKSAFQYCAKTDPEPLLWGLACELIDGTTSKCDIVVKMIDENKTLKEVKDKMPGFFMMNMSKIVSYQQYAKLEKTKKVRLEWEMPRARDDLTEEEHIIGHWIFENMKKPREFKQKQLFIWGTTNLGKSTLINNLKKYLSGYPINKAEDYYCAYYDGEYDFAYIDEFKHDKSIQWLNTWLDGSSMNLKKKNGWYIKEQNIPTIILSNYSLEDNYRNVSQNSPEIFDTLKGRLEIVHVKEFIKVLN